MGLNYGRFELEYGVELKIVGGLAMKIASTLSLEDYQRHGGLHAVEKCTGLDLCHKVKSSRRFKKGSDVNCHCLFHKYLLLFGSVILEYLIRRSRN